MKNKKRRKKVNIEENAWRQIMRERSGRGEKGGSERGKSGQRGRVKVVRGKGVKLMTVGWTR